MDRDLSRFERYWNCRLTTRGRQSGEPREVTIWFALGPGAIYLTGSASHPHWCKNVAAHGEVSLSIGGEQRRGAARRVDDEQEARVIRQCFIDRYWLARLSQPFGGYKDSIPFVVEVQAPGTG